MENLSHSESRRLYSWWWDSHICPKNSKWLQENLTDIDAKVKAMIKLIEEDADSFARRAEMYYKKRPELMKLVEEFYRAYRALAERYDYAMGELRQANKTMEEAFPNQAHNMVTDDSSCGSSGLDSESHTSGSGESNPSCSESEIQTLRNALAKIQSDKDAIYLQYQESLKKLSEMERDLTKAQRDAGGLDERASRAEVEVKILKEALAELKAEKDVGLVQYNQCLEVISRLETNLSAVQLEAKGHDERASKAEIEATNVKQELTRLEAEKDAGLLQYKKCVEKISVLEATITLTEENSRMLNEQLERAEVEVRTLRKNLTELNEEKESVAAHYHQCLEKISKLENEISRAQETTEQLNREVKEGAEKLKSAEEHCDVLEKSNQHLKSEAENLVLKIAMKDQALLEKHGEIERLQTLMHEEHSHFLQIKSALQNLQKLYSQSQQEQRTLALELKYGLQLLNNLELSKQGFKEEMEAIAEENRTLHELSFSSTKSLQKQQMEISKLKEIREKLERELDLNAEESNAFQHEARQIKDDIQHLNDRYQAMLEQLQSLGLNPTCFAASVKDLQNENSKLKEVCKVEHDEKEALREKSKDMDELLIENAFMEFSLSGLNGELDGLRATVKKFQESCQVLQEEKSLLADEKSTLLSQLQIITQSFQKLLEKNTLLEKSLSDAKIELEGLKTKSSDLEEFCNLLNKEKHNLLKERSILVFQLESVEAKLSDLERRFTELEEKYADVGKDKESTDNQVEELRASIFVQKEKHANHKHLSEARLANLENLVHVLQEEQRLGKIEFGEELDKAVNAQMEMFIMQNCVEELEQMNLALLTKCEKHIEASRFSDKVISELETENLMQLMEEEFLLHQIRKFKMVMHQVCGALQIDPNDGHDKGIKEEEIPTLHILDKIEGLKSSLEKHQKEKQQLLAENSILITSRQEHQSEVEKLESEKDIMEEELVNLRQQNVMLQKEKTELLEKNMQLRTEVANREEKENTSKSEFAALHVEMIDLQRTNQVFQEDNDKMLEEKNSLFRNVLDLKDAISAAEDENSVIFHEVLALRTLSLVYESFLTENVIEQKALSEHLSNLGHLNSDLNQELGALRKKFQLKEEENVYLNKSTERMDKELLEVKNANCSLSHQIENSENLLKKKDAEMLEMEKRLKEEESMNAEFCRYIEELKMDKKESRLVKDKLDRQILELSENCINQEKDIEHLNEVNKSYLSEMKSLLHEVEQHRAREETLNLQLLDKTNEFKLWEAEAATFYFDLQISSISEALLESKVTELARVCKILDDESAAKSLVIKQMQGEIGELKGRLSAYIPVITSLKEDFASLEHTYLLWTDKASAVGNGEQKDTVIETCHQENSHQSLRGNESTLIPDGVSDLMNMQIRIRAVEKVLIEELENLTANAETRALAQVTEDSNLEATPCPEIDSRKVAKEPKESGTRDLNAWRIKPESRVLMKDIQLDHNSDDLDSHYCKREHSKTNDHVLELCDSDDHEISEADKRDNPPTEDAMTCHHQSENSERRQSYSSELEIGVDEQELSKVIQETPQNGKRIILQRLASDAQKLAILKMSLQDLKKKPETKKKSKEVNEIEYETVKRHIEEVEAAVVQQVGINDHLAKVLESTTCSDREILEKHEHIQRKVTEQARRDSEQIGRLQFEVQNIQYILLKLADEKNNKGKSKTGILLRDFIQIGRKNSRRRSKVCVCGCSRKPSTNED